MKKRGFVRYTKKGQLVPGSLVVTTNGGYPDKTALWKEVSTNYCCEINPNTSREFPLSYNLALTMSVLPSSTNLFIQIQCVGDGSKEFTSFFTGPSLNSYQEVADYFNTNFSFWGYFEVSGSILTLYLNPQIRNLLCEDINDFIFSVGDM
jgi:hypothetical protein